jgi:threonylcarbamoyladenosine tRNA methylthiotransferase MtaB
VRIRLSSLEPERLTDDEIDRLSAVKPLCPHFHLSLQSACDDTLKRMKRRYSFAEYSTVVKKLRAHFPGCAITTDVMTGFPGETEAEFLKGLQNIDSIGFADMHIFPFSRRAGTVADTLEDQVS